MSPERIEAVAKKAKMTSKETAIIKRLMLVPNIVVTREVLRNEIPGVAPRTLDTYIKNIRRKLAASGESVGGIETSPGVGFRFSEKG